MPDLTLMHTSPVHCATFDSLAPESALHHIVRTDWLERARAGVDEELRHEIQNEVAQANGPVLCSCTTLGEIAEQAGAIRIDWPMMQAAARIGAPVLMAYCLDSTLEPSRALLQRAFDDSEAQIRLLPLPQAWPLFEAGDHEGFVGAIAKAVIAELMQTDAKCIVLAQASMAPAGHLIRESTDIAVLTSPELAMQYMLDQV